MLQSTLLLMRPVPAAGLCAGRCAEHVVVRKLILSFLRRTQAMNFGTKRALRSFLRRIGVGVLFLSFGTSCGSSERPQPSGTLPDTTVGLQSRSDSAALPHGGDTLLARVLATRTPGEFPQVEIRAELTNRGEAPIDIAYGDCALRIGLYLAEGDERLRWDSARYRDACTLSLHTGAIRPGESLAPDAFSIRLSLDRLLSDTTPPARYRVKADLEVLREGEPITQDTLRLPGTMIDLARGL